MKNLIKNPLSFNAVILVLVGLLLPLVAWLGYRNNVANLELMLTSKGESLIETVLHEAENAILADNEVLDIIEGRLRDNTAHLRKMYATGQLNAEVLKELVDQSGLARFEIYDRAGELVLTSAPDSSEVIIPEQVETAIDSSSSPEIMIDLTPGLVALVSTDSSGAVYVAGLDSGRLTSFRRRIGIGLLLDDLSSVQGVVYAALQDSLGIIAASSEVISLSSIADDPFLRAPAGVVRGRYGKYLDRDIYEMVSGFQLGGVHYGYLRVGFSTDEIKSIAAQDRKLFYLGMIIFFVLLAVVASLYVAGRRQLRFEIEHSRVKGFSDSVLDGINEAVLVLDHDNRIVLLNRACEKLCGISDDVNGKSLAEVNSFLHDILDGSKVESASSVEFLLHPGTESQRPVMVSITPLEIRGQRFRTLIMHDLTDRKEAEKLALRNQRYKTMAEMSAGVAHEIRNPLNAIGMNVQRLKLEFSPAKEEEKEEYGKFIDTIRSEVERLNKIVQQFLAFARFPEPELEPGDFSTVIEQALKFIEPEISARKIAIVTDIGSSGEAMFDPSQVRQVINNLVLNAIDALAGTGDAEIRVIARKDKGRYRISVSDNGPGIEKQEQEKIFEPFYSTKTTGSGLGLAIVQRIVNEHHGAIEVKGRAGGGTEFIIEFPVLISQPG